MTDVADNRRGALRRVKEEDLQAIEDRLLNLEKRVRKDHEVRAQYAAGVNAESNIKKKSHYDLEHEGNEQVKGEGDTVNGGRKDKHRDQGIQDGDGGGQPRHQGRWRSETGHRGNRRNNDVEGHPHDENTHAGDDKPLALDATNRRFGPPGTDTFVMVTLFGLVLVVALFVARKVRKQRTRSYQSID